ncbi:WXG100 family type VII secretion target [Clostridium sp.]|uniref:WXG100 family type VII secretion target n=1 Tax=Clostridium sp. TaxID=1506 RepID=UPI0026352ABA|nr:WXG100 family type VII secretion target [uncultured Clostridium sp.]
MSRIMITPEELRASASKFTQKAGEVTDIITTLRGEVNRLESSWEGAAQSSFLQAFLDMSKVLEQFPKVCSDVTGQLNGVAQTIEETDASLASQLKG